MKTGVFVRFSRRALKWSPLSRPFSARNKLSTNGVSLSYFRVSHQLLYGRERQLIRLGTVWHSDHTYRTSP
jgi:hypothetical protein